MSRTSFMNKVRYWDSLIAKSLMRHFYFMFFQIVLVIVFFFWLANTIQVIDVKFEVAQSSSLIERIMVAETINTSIIVLLLLLNSFWMLFIFNGIQYLGNLLKDVNYNINKLRAGNK